jgi:hypothetical protein
MFRYTSLAMPLMAPRSRCKARHLKKANQGRVRPMTVKGRSLLAGVVSLIAATGIVAAAVVVLPGTASAAPRRNCLLSVASHPRRALDIRGESVFFRNFLLGKDMKFGFTMGGERSIIDNFDNILSSGESCLLSTASPRVSGFLSVCVPIPGGEQIPPQTGHCEGVRYSIENPAFGTPKVEVLPPSNNTPLLSRTMDEGESSFVRTTLNGVFVLLTIHRDADSPDYKNWVLTFSPGIVPSQTC